MKAVQTGYYGVPGRTQTSKVHVTRIVGSVWAGGLTRKPLCGSRMAPRSEFQFCANGVYLPYVECRTCHKLAQRLEVGE